MSKKSTIVGNLYISLWVLNLLQGLYITSSFLSLVFYIPFLAMSVYYSCKALVSYSNIQYIKTLFLLLIFLCVYGIIHMMFGFNYDFTTHNRDNKRFLIDVLSSFTPILTVYVLTIKGAINEKTILRWILIFVVLTTLEYFDLSKELALKWSHVDMEQFTNNTGYIFLSLIPLVFFLHKRPIVQYLLLAYIMFYVFISMKRGAIIIGVLMLLWFLYYSLRTISKKKKIIVFSLIMIFLFASISFVLNYYATNDFFQLRLSQTLEGNTSNRDYIYISFMHYFFNDASFSNILLGGGADATLRVSGNFAHSDWIELLIDCGIIGVFIYLIYWIGLYGALRSLKNRKLYIPFAILGACFIYTFLKSIFSMSFSMNPFYISLSIGYAVAQLEINNRKRI